uniref:Uncharacterized protein n=1 Tax=Amphimedon queenslandica TaxID=400682 RepID=A0A1X7VTJ9_AMPQE
MSQRGKRKGLRRLHDQVQQHLPALKSLGHVPSAAVITSVLELKLDTTTMFEWQRHSQDESHVPHYEKLMDFIDQRAQASVVYSQPYKKNDSLPLTKKYLPKQVPSFPTTATNSSSDCVLCKSEKHPHYICTKFKEISYDKKGVLKCQESRDLPTQPVLFDDKRKHLSDLKLSDPNFGIPSQVDALLGGVHQALKPSVTSYQVSVSSVDDILLKFWEIVEARNSDATLSLEERTVLSHFQMTHSRSPEGRFIVTLPKKPIAKSIGESRSQAESSTTTKMRPVFDASAKSETGISLNDTLFVGPTVHPTLVDVLLRFRLHRIALTTDVTKMYRAIQLADIDKDLHRYVWHSNPEDTLSDYRITCVTFGISDSSFAANVTLKQNAIDWAHKYPLAAKAVKQSFYIDDDLTGADTVYEAISLHYELQQLISCGTTVYQS